MTFKERTFWALTQLKYIIGFFLGLCCYFSAFVGFYIIFFGSAPSRIVLAIILVYQYLFARKLDWYRRLLRWFSPYNYFHENGLIFEETLPKKKVLLGCHPHGILSMNQAFNNLRDPLLFENFYMLASGAMLNTPLAGLFTKIMGVYPVDPRSFKKLMQKEANISFLPGGFEEATITSHTQDKVFIKNRKGFVKYAIQYGYTIVPAYTFNENKAFYTWNGLENFRLFLNRFRKPGVFFLGKYVFFPRRDIKFYSVVGKGIQCERKENPSQEDVDKYHDMYVEELKRIYYKYRDHYGGSDKLEVM